MFETVLVVCTGNICRSPVAAALLVDAAASCGHVMKVESAGTAAVVGSALHPMSRRLVEDRGLDLNHNAHQIDASLVRSHQLILGMEARHVDWIHRAWPQSRGRVFRWRHWIAEDDVSDPVGGAELDFIRTLELIEQGLEGWIRKLRL